MTATPTSAAVGVAQQDPITSAIVRVAQQDLSTIAKQDSTSTSATVGIAEQDPLTSAAVGVYKQDWTFTSKSAGTRVITGLLAAAQKKPSSGICFDRAKWKKINLKPDHSTSKKLLIDKGNQKRAIF